MWCKHQITGHYYRSPWSYLVILCLRPSVLAIMGIGEWDRDGADSMKKDLNDKESKARATSPSSWLGNAGQGNHFREGQQP